MIPILKYLWLTIKHKCFVFRAGLKTKAPLWRLVIHDLSKFTPAEAPHYARQYFGDAGDPDGYASGWLHHIHHNPHHWEHWVSIPSHCYDHADLLPLPMPEWAVREMVADWMGASRAYEGHWPDPINWTWLINNRAKMLLHPTTNHLLDKVLSEIC